LNFRGTLKQISDVSVRTDGQTSGVVLSDVEKQHIAESTYACSGVEVQLMKSQNAINGVKTASALGIAP
jgi:hypothetical protein